MRGDLRAQLRAVERQLRRRPPARYGWVRRRIRVPYPDGSRPPEWYWGELPEGPGLDVPDHDDRFEAPSVEETER